MVRRPFFHAQKSTFFISENIPAEGGKPNLAAGRNWMVRHEPLPTELEVFLPV